MLNINAKAFVPPGASDANVTNGNENTLFRYRLSIPLERKADTSTDARHLSNVASLLSSRHLLSVLGGIGDEDSQLFTTEAFLKAVNLPNNPQDQVLNAGFLLSRTRLSFSADINAVIALNDAPGFLIHMDLPRECGADVSTALGPAWESFFSIVEHDDRVSCFGYSCSLVGMNGSRTNGTYRHYFFAACLRPEAGRPAFAASAFAMCPAPIVSIIPVNAIVPFTCGTRTPLSVMITVGDAAKEAFLKGSQPDFFYEMKYDSTDAVRTFTSVDSFNNFFFDVLQGDCKWERTYILQLHISPCSSRKEVVGIPIWDVIQCIGNLCDDTACNVIAVSFSDTDAVPGSKRLLQLNPNEPFYVNESFGSAIEKGISLNTVNTAFGGVPQMIKRRLSAPTREAADKAIQYFITEQKLKKDGEQQLTRMNFEEAADSFAKHRFNVCRRAAGVPVLVGTDGNGDIFGVDMDSGSVFGLPACFGGVVHPIPESVFKGTLTSSCRGYQEFRIIIDDVLVFQGSYVLDVPFSKRWRCVENLDLDDEHSWPHATREHIVILRADYIPFDRTEEFFEMLPSDHNTLGLTFIPCDQAVDTTKEDSYMWIPPDAFTANFIALRVESAPDGNADLNRVFLAVDKGGEEIEYEGEFTDYQVDAFPIVSPGCTVECVLRRAEDGAHWWDVLRDFEKGERSPSTFEEVDMLVHSPGITKKEMLWLLTASAYECGRCHKINDAGSRNPRHNTYWCKNCWRETGHGDCMYCNRSCVLGMLDAKSMLFYCKNCWNNFSQTNSLAEIGYHVPPPPQASFTQQVTTRCISLLIDIMNPKCPSNDVVDLCCGGSVVRKWMRNKATGYIGIDLKRSVVDALTETIANSTSELPTNARYDIICADAFSEDFWTNTITRIHPRQFHVVTCFAGMHHVFENEATARHFVGSVANALVPNGVFIGIIMDASVLYAKGKKFSNSVLKVEWEDDAIPRIGYHFSVSTEGSPMRERYVIPIDFLIAVAAEYGLNVVTEGCRSFRELIEKDPNWTMVPNADEKDYLCGIRTFAFKKQAAEQAPTAVC